MNLRDQLTLLEKLNGRKERYSAMMNEKILDVLKLLKTITKTTESSLIEISILFYLSTIWDTLPEEKKNGIKLLIGDDEVFKVGSELKKSILEL